MTPVLELDAQTASFVRQLEEQRKLEKNLLLERVRGTKEGTESVFNDINPPIPSGLVTVTKPSSSSTRSATSRTRTIFV
jgi:hypothetical protein